MKKLLLLFLCTLLISCPINANGAAKAGVSCPKKGQVEVVGTKKFTCVVVGKKLIWNKGINTAPKKSEPIPGLDLTLSFGSVTINSYSFSPGETINVLVSGKSPAGIKETSMILKNEKYPLAGVVTGKLKSGNSVNGIWALDLTIPKNIDPQSYNVEVSATNAKNEFVIVKKFEIRIDPNGSNPNLPTDNLLRNAEGIVITCGGKLKLCPQLTPSSPDTSVCKIERPTPNWENPMSIGFTRPKWIKAPFSEADVLVIPFSFSDLQVDDSFLTRLKEEIKTEDKWLETNSYGKFKVNWTIPNRDSWFDFKGSYAENKSQLSDDQGRRNFVQDLLRSYDKIDLTKFKSILIFGGYSNTISGGMEFGGSIFSTPRGNVQGVSFTFGRQSLSLDHNLGHSIFAFEDLYLIQLVKAGTFKDSNPEKWDIMGGGSNFVAWHRWINGWIFDQQVSCLASEFKTSVFFLSNLDKNDGKPKLISVASSGIATMAEYRYDQSRSRGGLVVYGLDPKVEYGQGPMTGEDLILQPGEKLTKNGITFEVIDADLDGIYVKVLKA